ncbi:hypothetical protein BC827DRAFT_174254 [Russula dissimulans]|nr:hypothetical protein BC827DRAFT_174254 [Russula dissimulans]
MMFLLYPVSLSLFLHPTSRLSSDDDSLRRLCMVPYGMKSQLCDLINCRLRIPYFVPITVGHPLTFPTRQPIIITPDRQVWELKHIEDDRYTVTINGFVVVSEDNFVWSYVGDSKVPATEWVIQHYGGLGSKLYTITDPKSGGRAWTLKEGYSQVSLEDATNTDPIQLWVFDIVLPNAGKSQKI